NQLGRPVEAYVWTGKVERGTYFVEPWSDYTPGVPVPEWLSWDLWHGPLTSTLPYSEDLTPRRWRAFWETGGGQLADWGCHLLDMIYFAYDLPPHDGVLTHTICATGKAHYDDNQNTLTFHGGSSIVRVQMVQGYTVVDSIPYV